MPCFFENLVHGNKQSNKTPPTLDASFQNLTLENSACMLFVSGLAGAALAWQMLLDGACGLRLEKGLPNNRWQCSHVERGNRVSKFRPLFFEQTLVGELWSGAWNRSWRVSLHVCAFQLYPPVSTLSKFVRRT